MKSSMGLPSRKAGSGPGWAVWPALGGLVVCVALGGCATAPIAKHSAALSVAVAPVVEQSADAYRDAVALDNLRADYEAVVAYNAKDASYNPRNVPELLSQKDIQARLAVVAALQVYSESLLDISRGTSSPELDAASASVGNNLSSLGNDLSPSIESVLGIAGTQGATGAATISPAVRNGISTGVNALGQFLVNRTIEKDLPGKIVAMDPTVEQLCKVLSDDIKTIEGIEQRDYDRILNLQKQFILEDEQPGKDVNPVALRAEMMKVPEVARQQREANQRLEGLRAAIVNLAMTHHALAAEAQHNNPQGLSDKLAALAAVGKNLGTFYSSLPTE